MNAIAALAKHRHHMDQRYIELLWSPPEEQMGALWLTDGLEDKLYNRPRNASPLTCLTLLMCVTMSALENCVPGWCKSIILFRIHHRRFFSSETLFQRCNFSLENRTVSSATLQLSSATFQFFRNIRFYMKRFQKHLLLQARSQRGSHVDTGAHDALSLQNDALEPPRDASRKLLRR